MVYTSKYFKKTHTTIVYNLEEEQCPHCSHWFMLDSDFCKSAPTDDYDDYYRLFCPYCGHTWRKAI